MRITNKMMNNNYMRDLNNSMYELSKATTKATNYRKFQSASDDPSGATKAFQLRREYGEIQSHERNVENLEGLMSSAESALMSTQEKLKDVSDRILQGITGTMNDEAREVIAKELRAVQEAIVQDLNTSYSGQYLFGGTESSEPPFTVGEDGDLYYRGFSVDSGLTFEEKSATPPVDPAVGQERLEKLSKEKVLVDLGFGIDPNNPNSGFDSSLPGINFVGFGTTTVDGKTMPNNIYNVIGQIADYMDPKKNANFDMDTAQGYLDHFQDSHNNFLEGITDMGSKSHTLEYTKDRLATNKLNVQEKINYVEFVSPEEAITEFKMQEFTHRATLAIGNKVLQPSLIDFMN